MDTQHQYQPQQQQQQSTQQQQQQPLQQQQQYHDTTTVSVPPPESGATLNHQLSTSGEIKAPPRLVNYQPSSVIGMPAPLNPSTDALPWEKKALAEQRRDDSRKKKMTDNHKKKKGFLNTVTKAMTIVATAATDAVSVVVEDFKDTQSPNADGRFHTYFPGFPLEKAFAEYKSTMTCGPDTAITGQFYVTNRYFAFYGEQFNQYILFMLPLSMIRSIQRGYSTRLPASATPMQPKPVTIVEGGAHPSTPSPPPSTHHAHSADPSSPSQSPPSVAHNPHPVYPKLDSLVIFTEDNMKHVFTGINHSCECYNVLDHAWRNPNPAQLPMNSNVASALHGTYHYAQAYGEGQPGAVNPAYGAPSAGGAYPPSNTSLPPAFYQSPPAHDPLYPPPPSSLSSAVPPPAGQQQYPASQPQLQQQQYPAGGQQHQPQPQAN